MPRFFAIAAASVIAAQAFGLAAQAQTEDRYGAPSAGAASAAPMPMALLSWPGKAAAPRSAPMAPTQAAMSAAAGPEAPVSIYGPPPAPQPTRLRGVILAAPSDEQQPWPVAPALAPPPPPAPPAPVAAMAAPPTRQPAPMPTSAVAQQAQQSAPSPDGVAHSTQAPHFYSVARQYGVKPDPDQLPAQFFADSSASDMAAPPPPLAPTPVVGSQALTSPLNSASNRAREIAIDTADAGADGPTGGAGGM